MKKKIDVVNMKLDDANIRLGEGVIEWQAKNLEPKRYDYDLKPGDIVLDIGAYKGEFGNRLKKLYPGIIVESFEATDNNAAWIKDGEIEIGGAGNTASAFNKYNAKKFKCVDIKKYIAGREIKLIKINIEGGEYALVTYMIAERLMFNVENLQVQFHELDTFDFKLLYATIDHNLKFTHEIDWRYPYCWESWKRKESTTRRTGFEEIKSES